MNKKITRKEAIKKVGLTALASTSLFLLETKANSSTSANGCGSKSYGDNDYGDWNKRGKDYDKNNGYKDKNKDKHKHKDKNKDKHKDKDKDKD